MKQELLTSTQIFEPVTYRMRPRQLQIRYTGYDHSSLTIGFNFATDLISEGSRLKSLKEKVEREKVTSKIERMFSKKILLSVRRKFCFQRRFENN